MVRGVAHCAVEEGPHRCKDPGWWVERGLRYCAVRFFSFLGLGGLVWVVKLVGRGTNVGLSSRLQSLGLLVGGLRLQGLQRRTLGG